MFNKVFYYLNTLKIFRPVNTSFITISNTFSVPENRYGKSDVSITVLHCITDTVMIH